MHWTGGARAAAGVDIVFTIGRSSVKLRKFPQANLETCKANLFHCFLHFPTLELSKLDLICMQFVDFGDNKTIWGWSIAIGLCLEIATSNLVTYLPFHVLSHIANKFELAETWSLSARNLFSK